MKWAVVLVNDVLRVRSLIDRALSHRPMGHVGWHGVSHGSRVWESKATARKPSRVQLELVELQGEREVGSGAENIRGREVAWRGVIITIPLFRCGD